ncbi:hypothetical protein F0562_019467 [Nyssa sinensis]|uniref:Uncharacterized protein n=1 Tax=Nyssa sinensis TaxID=561372 RepID=A0A5J5BPS3_9ASTE|nr:hypothetical protein F0562_019467 [Nyssa sinensis]
MMQIAHCMALDCSVAKIGVLREWFFQILHPSGREDVSSPVCGKSDFYLKKQKARRSWWSFGWNCSGATVHALQLDGSEINGMEAMDFIALQVLAPKSSISNGKCWKAIEGVVST